MVPDLLDCLKGQTYPRSLIEIILVDNGSSEVILPDQLEPNVQVLRCKKKGAYAARNYGVAKAQGRWLLFTDADCLPGRSWVAQAVSALGADRTKRTFVAGRVESMTDNGQPSVYEIFDMVRGIPQAHYVRRGYAATANLAVSRTLISEVGGFNEQLYSGGDADFCHRARRRGFNITYVEAAVVNHRTRTSWNEIATKARRVKGGQLTCKSNRYKVWIFIRTILSPAITSIRLASCSQFPLKYRLIASFVYIKVWRVELLELIRVGFGGKPERR